MDSATSLRTQIPHPVAKNATRVGHPVVFGDSRPVALFILFAGPARARIVPSNFFLPTDDLLYWLGVSGPGHTRLFEFTALAAHEGLFQFICRRGHHARRSPPVAISRMRRRGSGFWLSPNRRRRRAARTCIWRAFQDLHQVQVANRVFLEALHHRFKHFERLFLVLDQRIVLAVPAQPDSFLQVSMLSR